MPLTIQEFAKIVSPFIMNRGNVTVPFSNFCRNTVPRGGQRLAQILPKLTREVFRDRGFYQASILTQWSDIVGNELAARSCPEKVSREGVLTLRVEGSFALEFQHMEPQVLERIATHFGYRAITRISLRQGPMPSDNYQR